MDDIPSDFLQSDGTDGRQDATGLGEDSGTDFDLSDILADYFSERIHQIAARDSGEVSPTTIEVQSGGTREPRISRVKREKDKHNREEPKQRTRSASDGDDSRDHSRRSRSVSLLTKYNLGEELIS
ncbi:uncharacterized protein LOC100907312 [Galendromus occidentalis]|uniref:Uncharacterized protein LOC100907312 n=1 Tax=Galendromus occidentalis TaxID=34638 RepID=A0AAJ6QRV8_9ACAR|nr:uncharacterized protein LOC100907312 [Galendromus occidentalis]